MRRCLAITGVFPPYGGAGAVRQVKLFNHLRAYGWRVDVVAPRGNAGWHRDAELDEEASELRVVRVGWPPLPGVLQEVRAVVKDPAHSGVSLLRSVAGAARHIRDLVAVPDEKVPWAVAAWARARWLLRRNRYDALFTSSWPYSVHLAALALERRSRPRWVADQRDPWVGHLFRAQSAPWRQAVDRRLEAAVVAGADALVVVAASMRQQIRDRYGARAADKLHVITNGYDPADFIAEGPAGDRFELLYVGTFDSRLTPPDPFLAAIARLLRSEPAIRARLRFRVLGAADLESGARLRRWIAEHDAGDLVRVEGFRGHRTAMAALCGASALALSLAPGATVLPSKVFEYLASGRPILAAVPPGDCRAILERCGGAAIADPRDPATIAGHLDRLLAGVDTTASRKNELIEQFDFRRLARRMAAVLAGDLSK